MFMYTDYNQHLLDNVKKIHFIGCGGSGMYPLIQILAAKGYEISGSDVLDGSIIRSEREMGVKVSLGHSADNVIGVDMVVYSAAIHDDNPEMQAAQAHAGSHAVTDGDIGVLFFGGGLCKRRHSIVFGKSFRLHFLHGGFRLSSLFGGGVLCKGRNGQRQQQRGRQQQACNAFCFHGHHSLFPRNISRLRNCFHDKEMKGKCQLTKRGKSQEKVVKTEAFEAECRK